MAFPSRLRGRAAVTRNPIPPMASKHLPRLYTVRETATYAHTSQKTVRRWLNSGMLPFHRLGRQIRIAEADLLASCAPANRTVEATTFYTVREDGMSQPWFGRVWLNPPYGRRRKSVPNAESFVNRFAEFFAAGAVTQGCLLLKTEHLTTKWFNASGLADYIVWASAGRRQFSGKKDVPHGSVIVGCGVDPAKFRAAFAPLGGEIYVPKRAA